MSDLATIAEARHPRTALAEDLARRLFPAKRFALFAVLMFVGLSFLALVAGTIAGLIIMLATMPPGLHQRSDGWIIVKTMVATLGVMWLVYGALILPHHVRSKRRPVQDVVRDGDLFDAREIEVKLLANLVGTESKREHTLLVERDGARIHVASPVHATKVLHRLGTHVAIAFDEHGTAHAARAWQVA